MSWSKGSHLLRVEEVDAASMGNVRRRVERAEPVVQRALTDFVSRLSSTFDPRFAIPESARAEVLARPVP